LVGPQGLTAPASPLGPASTLPAAPDELLEELAWLVPDPPSEPPVLLLVVALPAPPALLLVVALPAPPALLLVAVPPVLPVPPAPLLVAVPTIELLGALHAGTPHRSTQKEMTAEPTPAARR
jgi:hypothetical protein